MNTPTVMTGTTTTEPEPSRIHADSNRARLGDAGEAVDFVNPAKGQDFESSWHMLRLILDAIPQPVYWKDRDFVYQGCNTAFSAEPGHKQQGIIGKTDI